VTGPDSRRGAVLLQRGDEDLIAAAILLLADRGRLAVDDAVHRFLGGCPPGWNSMTIGHLLSHTAGLVHWLDLPGLDLTRPIAATFGWWPSATRRRPT
jgi:CubicO group peptidase (beta-lactamase class C family)